jgi:hypothetical protein
MDGKFQEMFAVSMKYHLLLIIFLYPFPKYFVLKLVLEMLLSSTSTVTKFYFGWDSRRSGLFMASVALLMFPANSKYSLALALIESIIIYDLVANKLSFYHPFFIKSRCCKIEPTL